MTPEEIMERPYTYCLIRNTDGIWSGTIKEFPGCIAQNSHAGDCITDLLYTALDWIEAAQDLGQTIPEPAIYCETDKSYTPKTELGQKLMALRNKAIADGMTLLDVDEIMGQEIPEPEVKK